MLFSLQDVFLYIGLLILAYTIKFFYDVCNKIKSLLFDIKKFIIVFIEMNLFARLFI